MVEKIKNELNGGSSMVRVLKVPLLILYTLLAIFSFYHIAYANRIIPGVRIGNVDIGGKTYDQAKIVLSRQQEKVQNELKLTYEGNVLAVNTETIGLSYDWDSALARAFEIGRTGDFFKDTKNKIMGPVKGSKVDSFYEYDNNALSTRFSSIKGELNIEPVSSRLELYEEGLKVTESKIGRKVADKPLYDLVITSFDNVDFDPKEITIEQIDPEITEVDLEPLRSSVQKMIEEKITIVYKETEEVEEKVLKKTEENDNEEKEDVEKKEPEYEIITKTRIKSQKTWEVEKELLLEFISFNKNDRGEVSIEVYDPKFKAFSETITYEVNKPPKGKVTETDGDKVVSFEITQSGIEVDLPQFKKDFEKAILSDEKTVDLAVTETKMDGDKDKYGIVSLLGLGTSNFKGSIQGRINNLTLAASRTDGVLVPPGAVYSMNNTIGEISAGTGYDTAYIIQNGRTVLGEGGGVCQTSTTMFRAALNAGLPIIKRYPHAYRVHYYEINSPVGIDAAIFQPSIDFQFKNDTPNYLLIQTNWDLESYNLFFRIYGTPDGRKVEMSVPVVTNQIAPPETLYQDDPSLKKGVVKQVDWSAWGATASFTRLVTRDGESLHDDTFTTRYQPWRAVYLKGTKED